MHQERHREREREGGRESERDKGVFGFGLLPAFFDNKKKEEKGNNLSLSPKSLSLSLSNSLSLSLSLPLSLSPNLKKKRRNDWGWELLCSSQKAEEAPTAFFFSVWFSFPFFYVVSFLSFSLSLFLSFAAQQQACERVLKREEGGGLGGEDQ